MTTQPQYTSDQQTFCLSLLSNIGSRKYYQKKGDADQIAQSVKDAIQTIFSDSGVQQLIGSWELVWGPKVAIDAYGQFKEKPINTMFIAHLPGSPSQFVVAIAGTNGKSVFDWFKEDFWVNGKVDWPYLPQGFSQTPTPQISNGTHYGLNSLLNMQSDGQTARDYLSQNATSEPGTVVTVTGHSLGGALSPSYALYLLDTQSDWDKHRNVTIKCLPTAGATPGDRAFAEYFNNSLGSNTHRVWNKLDIVPHAWEHDMLAQIPTLYEGIPASRLVKTLVESMMWKTKKQNYTQILASTEGTPSDVVQVPAHEQGDTPPLSFLKKHPFLWEALYQHTERYTEIFQIGEFAGIFTKILQDLEALPPNSSLKSLYISDEELPRIAELADIQAEKAE